MTRDVSEGVIVATVLSIINLAFVFVSVAWRAPNACRGIALMLAIFCGETRGGRGAR